MRWRALTLLLVACSSDDVKAPAVAALDAAAPDARDASDAAPAPEEPDAGPPPKPAIRCTEAELAAGAITDGGGAEVGFKTTAQPVQYTNRCLTVKAGATVGFRGSFRQHPLEPAGGDEPTPIPLTDKDVDGGALLVTFPTAGTFGFQCMFHPTLMYGAIKVVR